MSRAFPTIDWSLAGDPWHRVGVWCILYGGILAAPTLAVGGMLALLGGLGWLQVDGEAVWLLAVGTVSGIVVFVGYLLVRRSQRTRQQLHQIDESYWF
jgi:hypothetical protein